MKKTAIHAWWSPLTSIYDIILKIKTLLKFTLIYPVTYYRLELGPINGKRLQYLSSDVDVNILKLKLRVST